MDEAYRWLGLEGRVCVVTGAARGIGARIALELGKAGAHVALLDLEAKACEPGRTEIEALGGKALALGVDVSDPASVKAAAGQVRGTLGGADVLVNNAGIAIPAAAVEVGLADWNRVLAVNLTGPLLCAQAFGEQMLAKGKGAMVHIASLSGHYPQPFSGAYSVSKSGVAMLSEVLAYELAPRGVRSNAVSPGSIRTPLSEGLFKDQEIVARRQGMIPLRRFGEPNDIAGAVLFLASDRASYVTGQNLIVDGGYSRALMGLLPRPGFGPPPTHAQG
jgi:glucose 1-dehydrogenase